MSYLPADFSRGRDQVGAVVVIHLSSLQLERGRSEKEERVRLFRNVEDERLVFLGRLEEERCCRFRPDDEAGFPLRHLEGKAFVNLQRLPLKRLIPLDGLIDVPLNQSDIQRWPGNHLPIEGRHPDISVEQASREDQKSDDNFTNREDLPGPLMKYPIKGDIHQKNHKGEAVDTRDIGDLDKREIQILGMPEVCPGEPREKKGPEVLQGDPEKGSEHHRMRPEPLLQGSGTERQRFRKTGSDSLSEAAE